jgi:hypothetical protein
MIETTPLIPMIYYGILYGSDRGYTSVITLYNNL